MNYASDKIESIIVDFNDAEYKFTFYDKHKNFIGNFSYLQLIKYVISKLHPLFLKHIDIGSSFNIIETYICNVTELVDGSLKINIYNHDKSPFMGNIEMIMNLLKGLYDFEKHKLYNEIDIITHDLKLKKKIITSVRQLLYLLLNYSLKLIATISDKIKNDSSKKELKNMLLKYSVVIVYKLSAFVKSDLDTKLDDYILLQNDLVRMGTVKLEMYKKLEELAHTVHSQEFQINSILTTINNSI